MLACLNSCRQRPVYTSELIRKTASAALSTDNPLEKPEAHTTIHTDIDLDHDRDLGHDLDQDFDLDLGDDLDPDFELDPDFDLDLDLGNAFQLDLGKLILQKNNL